MLEVNFGYVQLLLLKIIFYTEQANTNGFLSFGNPPEDSFIPVKFPLPGGVPIVAPFWADVDSRGTGEIWVRNSTADTVAFEKIKGFVANAFTDIPEFMASEVIIQTWDRVGYYNKNINKVY